MSEEGYKKLMAELKELETVERPKISAAIAEARDKGDLSENAEYDAAKEAQGMLEMKINKLKTIIADAKIIDESKLKTGFRADFEQGGTEEHKEWHEDDLYHCFGKRS